LILWVGCTVRGGAETQYSAAMHVFVARIGAAHTVDQPVDAFERLAAADRFGEHRLTPDPAQAAVVLFTQCHMVDSRLRALREHPVARKHWEKVMVFDERDRPWRSFPGVYVNARARGFDARSQRAWGYLGAPNTPSPSPDPDLLFSFVGSATAPCRRPLFELDHPAAIVEEVRDFTFWDVASPGYEGLWARYREILGRSRFVLCPRGRGTSTFRLYEALGAGRVPVIISDEWVAPPGPDWDACSLRWPEGRTDGLVKLLEERDRVWPAMSSAATTAHSTFFSPEVTFHRVIELCRELRETGSGPVSALRVRSRSLAAALRERSVTLRSG